jgi:radical SAM superfamily enzyme with C-terminal helix-hairpin-helix motif
MTSKSSKQRHIERKSAIDTFEQFVGVVPHEVDPEDILLAVAPRGSVLRDVYRGIVPVILHPLQDIAHSPRIHL